MTNSRIRRVAPTRPYIFLHGVDETEITATPTALIWGHIDIKTSELHYVEGDDRVVVRRGGTGIYEIAVSACADRTGGNPGHFNITAYVNGVACICGVAHGVCGAASEHGNAILLYPIYLNEGDYVQTFVSVDNGTAEIEPGTGRFCMKMLSMEGWDNGAGGTATSDRRE